MPGSSLRRHACVALAAGLAWIGGATAGDVRVLDADAASGFWQPDGKLAPPPFPAGEDGRACVHLAFRITPAGTTSDVVVLKRWMEPGARDAKGRGDPRLDRFAQYAAAAVSTWRFKRVGDARAREVVTSTNLAFDARRSGDPAAIRAHCAIADLSRFITLAQRRVADRGGLMQGRFDRKQVSDPPMIPVMNKHDWFDGPIGPGN